MASALRTSSGWSFTILSQRALISLLTMLADLRKKRVGQNVADRRNGFEKSMIIANTEMINWVNPMSARAQPDGLFCFLWSLVCLLQMIKKVDSIR